MIVVLVVACGAAWESPVLELVAGRPGLVVLKRCVDVDDLLAAGAAGQADAALVALDAPGLDAPAVELLHRHQVRVVAVSGGGGPDAAQARAARIGIDAVAGDEDLPHLLDLLEAADAPAEATLERGPDPAPPPSAAGRVLVVWGPAGAPGRTLVATALASTLADRGLRTTLVDADPHAPSVAQHLGVLDEVSGLLRAARLTSEGKLEAGFGSVQRALSEQLTVVTGLPRADRWTEVRTGVVQHVLEVARGHGHVVVDTGFSLEDEPTSDLGTRPGRNQLTLGALEVADEIVVVGSADPVGLTRLARGLVELGELRELRGGAPVRVVVNRMRASLGWSEREIAGMVEGFTRRVNISFLPEDAAVADRALLAGGAVSDVGASDLGRGIETLAAELVPPSATRAQSGSRRSARSGRLRSPWSHDAPGRQRRFTRRTAGRARRR